MDHMIAATSSKSLTKFMFLKLCTALFLLNSCSGKESEPVARKYKTLLVNGHYSGNSTGGYNKDGGDPLVDNESNNDSENNTSLSDSNTGGGNTPPSNNSNNGGNFFPPDSNNSGDNGSNNGQEENDIQQGAQLFTSLGCSGCHGSGASPGPSRVRGVSASGIVSARSATSKHSSVSSWPNQNQAEQLSIFFQNL